MDYHNALAQAKGMLFRPGLGWAIFDGDKTMTRRTIKGVGPDNWLEGASNHVVHAANKCPYGVPGDHIYVKETHWAWGIWVRDYDETKGRRAWCFVDRTRGSGREYRFTQPEQPPSQLGNRWDSGPAWHKRPSLFMPRHATRSLLRIVSVRVERLQDISEADAMAEGAEPVLVPPDGGSCPHYQGFMELWKSINGAVSWDANPWVWVIEFERVTP